MTEATAKFPADFVLGRAMEMIEKAEKELDEARSAAIKKLETEPVKRGFLLWRREHYRTRAEAEGEYFGTNNPSVWYFETLAYETEHSFDQRILALRPLFLLAGAVALHGEDATVTLTANNCAALNIPMEAAQ